MHCCAVLKLPVYCALKRWVPLPLTVTPLPAGCMPQSMQKGGNKRCNDLWEANLPAGYNKPDEFDPDLEQFIRDKYERGVVRPGASALPRLPCPVAAAGSETRSRHTAAE